MIKLRFKLYQVIALLIFPLVVQSQNDTTMVFGINGKIRNIEKQDVKKEIDWRSNKKVKVETYKFTDGGWMKIYTEKIKLRNDSIFDIKVKGKFSDALTRVFKKQKDGKYKFTDWQENRIKRVGFTLSKIPLIFDGEVTEYSSNGNKKSVSVYENNELVSNQNWLENGDEYIDNVFYSVDYTPRYLPGMSAMHKHILETYANSNVDTEGVAGRIVVGFVVKENGMIDGVKIEEGIGWEFNSLAVRAFKTMPGTWQPARLDGEEVRYYQLFPINFIYHDYDFDSLDFRGGMLYWEIN